MVKWETQKGYNALFVLILNTRKNKYFESITETCIRQFRKHFQLLPKDLGVIISIVLIKNHKPELGGTKNYEKSFLSHKFCDIHDGIYSGQLPNVDLLYQESKTRNLHQH